MPSDREEETAFDPSTSQLDQGLISQHDGPRLGDEDDVEIEFPANDTYENAMNLSLNEGTTHSDTLEEQASSEMDDPLISDAPPAAEFISHDIDATLETLDDTSAILSPTINMPPPTRRGSESVDKSEEIPHKRAYGSLDEFSFALGLWCTQASITRRQYAALLEVMSLLKDLSRLKLLPKNVQTLKGMVKHHLPLTKMRRQEISLTPEKLPSFTPQEKRSQIPPSPKAWLHWFDPISLVSGILSSPSLRSKMHIGMAEFVEKPTELWQSMSWGTSIRSCSGQFSRYYDNSPIFPSDVVHYRCDSADCICQVHGSTKHMGRVYAVGRDYTSAASVPGVVTVMMQRMFRSVELPAGFQHGLSKMVAPLDRRELILVEDNFLYLSEKHIVEQQLDVWVDYAFDNPSLGTTRPMREHDAFVIRRIVNMRHNSIRGMAFVSPLRAELELNAFGRQSLVSNFSRKSISFPYQCFIDAFGLYRNMYRSITGIYIIPAALSTRERARRVNVFPLTLGPHGSAFNEVICTMQSLTHLDGGMDLTINGERIHVCAYPLAFIGDMPQQQENAGFKRQGAIKGCRSCLISKGVEKANLNFDTLLRGRYHHQTMSLRRQADNKTTIASKQRFCTEWGLQDNQTPLVDIFPALDIIRSRPADPAHSEYAGMSKQGQVILLETILTNDAQIEYAALLRRFPFPPGWSRLQSPLHHLKSWRMQEAGRASIIVPVLLRCWLRANHIQPRFLDAMQNLFADKIQQGTTIVAIVVGSFAAMGRSNAVVMAQSVSVRDRGAMHETVKTARASFQSLCEAAARAADSFSRSRSVTQSPPPRRSASPQMSMPVQTPSRQQSPASEVNLELESEYDILAGESDFRNMSKRGKEFRSFQFRPNVHQGLHLADLAKEYGTPYNCHVLQGEDQHRIYKEWVTSTNFRDVEKVLLSRENVQLTLRLCLGGAYARDEPDITKALSKMHQQCPTLFESILPPSERLTEDDESYLEIQDDAKHSQPAALYCLSRRYVLEELKFPINARHLHVNDPFLVQVRRAYAVDYDKPSAMGLERWPFQWCRKIIFTDPQVSSFL
ncbi:MAG: Glutathione reductase [Chaenotheca gracillima]|nr:MAG: Glutathione reductase [Chaenotheca gracillima]